MFCNKKPAIHETWTKWQILLGPGQQRGLQPHPASPLSTETKSFPQADELPIPWAPATLKKDLQSPQTLLDARIRGRIESWCCPIQQGLGWNLDRLKKTINNHSFSEAIRGPKSHRSWEESDDAQGWMQHWKVPAAIRVDVIIVTGSLNLFCLPSKSSKHLSPSSTLPTGCTSPDKKIESNITDRVPGFIWDPLCHCRFTSDS